MKTATKILIGSLLALLCGAILIDFKLCVTGITLMVSGALGVFVFSMLADLLEGSK